MGPRRYMAKRLTDFLLKHGSLNQHVRQIRYEQCIELTGPPPVSWWEVILTLTNGASSASMQGGLGHSAIVLIASFIITYELKRANEWKKKCRLYASSSSNNLSSALFAKQVDEMTMFFANSSFVFSWGSIVLVIRNAMSSSWVGKKLMGVLKGVYFMDRLIGISEEMAGASHNILLASSLWLIVLAILLTTGSMGWNILDPRGSGITNNSLSSVKGWSQRDWQHAAAVSISVGLVSWLAYTDLVLFRMVVHGDIQITFGLPQGMLQLIKQAFSSFIGFCVFYKFLPNEKIIVEHGKVPTSVKKTPKRPMIDPAIAERMSKLAREARKRVEARKNGEISPLRRTHSEGNFRTTPYNTPIQGERRRFSSRKSTLTSLPESRAQHLCPESPLKDITLAGPTLSSRDLMAKLKRSSSFTRPAERQNDSSPRELGVPELPVPVESISLPFQIDENGEEKKVQHPNEDESSSTPTPLSPPAEDLSGGVCVLPPIPKLLVDEDVLAHNDDEGDKDGDEPLSTKDDVSGGITSWRESLPSSSSLLLGEKLSTEKETEQVGGKVESTAPTPTTPALKVEAEAKEEEAESTTPTPSTPTQNSDNNEPSFIGDIHVVPSSGPYIISREKAISIGIKIHNSQWQSKQYGYAAKILLKGNEKMVDMATIRSWALMWEDENNT